MRGDGLGAADVATRTGRPLTELVCLGSLASASTEVLCLRLGVVLGTSSHHCTVQWTLPEIFRIPQLRKGNSVAAQTSSVHEPTHLRFDLETV